MLSLPVAAGLAREVHLDRRGLGQRPDVFVVLCVPVPGPRRCARLDVAAVYHEGAVVADDVPAPGAGVVAGRGVDDADAAAVKRKQREYLVLDLDVVAPPEPYPRVHPLRQPEPPAEYVEVVRALVHHDSAALAQPRPAPRAAVVVPLRPVPVVPLDIDLVKRPEKPRVYLPFHPAVHRRVAVLEVDGVERLRPAVRLVDVAGVGHGDGDGLFEEDVDVPLECRYRRLGMVGVRRGDDAPRRPRPSQEARGNPSSRAPPPCRTPCAARGRSRD